MRFIRESTDGNRERAFSGEEFRLCFPVERDVQTDEPSHAEIRSLFAIQG